MSTTNQNIQWDEKNSIEPKKNCLNNTAIDPNDIIKDINKNSIKSQCKDTGAISGIYKIVNKVNGKYYVGSSNDVCGRFGRWYGHRMNLNKNNHINKKLQNAWNKYGESNFEFVLVEQCDVSNLLRVEQQYLDIAKLNKKEAYNITFIAGRIDMNDEIKLKISKSAKQRLKCKFNHPLYGKHHKDSTKKLISDQNKLYYSVPENNPMYGVRRFGKENPNYGIRGKVTGYLNGRYNPTIYTFYNTITQESFIGTKFDFCKTYNLKRTVPNDLIRNHIKQNKNGWIKVS